MNALVPRFFCLFLCISTILTPLEPGKKISQYKVRTWNIESGLPGNTVFALRQTRDGYLWIGTRDGLVRFDGVDFEVYNKETNPALRGNEIRALYEDREGCLWIGTNSGGLTCLKEGRFTNYPVTKYKALTKIRAIAEDRRGNLWIGSLSEGLTCFNDGWFITYAGKDGLPGNRVRSLFKDSGGGLWAAVSTAVVKIIEPGVFRLYAEQDELPYLKTTCLYARDSQNLWIGTGEKGLFRLQTGEITSYNSSAGIPYPTINCLCRDRRKNLWVGTDGGGIAKLTDGEFDTLAGSEAPSSGRVYAIDEDREGNLWVGTLDGGLYRFRDSKFTTFTGREGLNHDHIYCVCKGRSGDLWIGGEGGLNRLKNGKISPVSTTRRGLLSTSVSAIFEDRQGNLWVGTWAGLHRFTNGRRGAPAAPEGPGTTVPTRIDEKGRFFSKLALGIDKKDGLSDNRIKSIMEDDRGRIWIGTEAGLNRYDPGIGRFTVFGTAHGLRSPIIEFLFIDSGGNLLIGTAAGLDILQGETITPFRRGARFEGTVFHCAYEDREGALYLGSDNGLVRVKGEETCLFNGRCGLTGSHIISVLEDDSGYLWTAGRGGVSRILKKELTDYAAGKIRRVHPDSYNEEDGMKSRWCTRTGCRTGDGRFWFPTTKGICMIDPAAVRKNEIPPPVIIEKCVANGETNLIKKSAPVFLEFRPGTRRLEFYYTTLSFINPGRIKFKIRLLGYDEEWVDRDNRRSATYTGLSPGEYTFSVTACNADGVWNETGASFSFYLKPHWYQTGWFFLFTGLFLASGITLFVKRRSRKLVREKQRLEQIVAARTGEIKNKNMQLQEQAKKLLELDKVKSRFFANISHEFRTPLTLIIGPLEQVLSDYRDKDLKKKVNLMLRNSRRLLGLINQLLELSKFDSGTIKLTASRQDIVPLLKGILHSFDSLAQQKELELVFRSEKKKIPLYFDPEKLEEVFANLLANALKFTPAGGVITLSVRAGKIRPGTIRQDFIEISVSDTGPGIPREDLAHIFDRFYQADSTYEHHRRGTGIGLAIAKEMVELHRGAITVHSPGGSGTSFIVQLPSGNAHLKPEEIVNIAASGGPPFCKKVGPKTFVDGPTYVGPRWHEVPSGKVFAELFSKSDSPNDRSRQEKDIILIIEDNADVREYVRGGLETHYAVAEARDGEDGLRQAGEIVPDLIICDIMMPGLDGYGVCRRLKSDVNTSHIPVILLTAKAGEEDIIEGLETGADDYITKPFNTRILLTRIKNLIDIRRQLQENLQREITLQPVRTAVSPVDKEFLKDLQAAIEENIADPDFNVEQLGRKLYMSRVSLYRKVLALTGETPTDFIRSLRLKKGAELLKSNFGSVIEIALEVGFSSAGYFTKCFKKKYHQLPTEYQAAAAES